MTHSTKQALVEHVARHVDPSLHLIPQDQLDRVFGWRECDIDSEFLGFTKIYLSLASIIPKHWTIVDLGCAYAPQAFIFKDHKAYIGVDASVCERFTAPNTTHYTMTTSAFLDQHAADFDQSTTFAICSYVPCWYGDDSRELTRARFRNVFTYYPARDKNDSNPFALLHEVEKGAGT